MNIIFIYLKYIVLLNLYLMYIILKNIHTIIRGYRSNIFIQDNSTHQKYKKQLGYNNTIKGYEFLHNYCFCLELRGFDL
jgi:hypothetical protein